MSMRASVLRADGFHVEELPIPQPGPGQVLARVRSCGICGSDLHLVKHGAQMAETAHKELGMPLPDLSAGLVLGHEFVAEITQYGPATRGVLPLGSRVCSVPFLTHEGGVENIGASLNATGAYAEYLLLSEANLILVPEGVSDDAAALTEPLAIGIHAVARAKCSEEEVALVIGCGPIGLAIVAVLKQLGVKHVIASDFSPRRRELAKAMGADVVINPQQDNALLALAAKTAGAAGVVFECVGVPGLIDEIVKLAPAQSRIVIAGIAPGKESLLPIVAIPKELCLQFVCYYTADEFAEALDLLSSGAINWAPWITGKVGLAEVPTAFAELANPELHAKVLIEPWR